MKNAKSKIAFNEGKLTGGFTSLNETQLSKIKGGKEIKENNEIACIANAMQCEMNGAQCANNQC